MFISNKYTKVILQREDLPYFYENLALLNAACKNQEFKEVLQSALVKKEDKIKFLLSFTQGENKYFENFIKLLVKNHRLDFISRIFTQLQRVKNKNDNVYIGEVYAKDPPSKSELERLESELSHKFKADIKLKLMKSDFDGLRISLYELGFELTFSMQRLQEKIKNYVLQAI